MYAVCVNCSLTGLRTASDGIASDDMGILKLCMLTYEWRSGGQGERDREKQKRQRKNKNPNRQIFHTWMVNVLLGSTRDTYWTIFLWKIVRLCHIIKYTKYKPSGINRHTTCHSLIWIGAANLILSVFLSKSSFLSIGDVVPEGSISTQWVHAGLHTFYQFWVTYEVVARWYLLLGISPLSVTNSNHHQLATTTTPTTVYGYLNSLVVRLVSHNTLHFMHNEHR